MPSGFVRDFANNSSFLGKRDSELSTYQSYTLNVPSGLLERYFIVPSGLLESIFLLASFLLPSSYLLPTHHFVFTKRIFSTQFITNSELSIFKFKNCQLQIVNCNIRFAEPSSKLPPCYPLAIPTFNIQIDLDAFDFQETSWNWHKLFQVSSFNFFIFEPRNQDTDISGDIPSDTSSLHRFSD